MLERQFKDEELTALLPSVERSNSKALFIPLDMLHNNYMESNSQELLNSKDLHRRFLALENSASPFFFTFTVAK